MKTAKQHIYEMLVESTGCHFLDSGDVYGRNWQQNQSKKLKDFENEPSVTVDYYEKHMEGYTISVFHYLVNQLIVDEICDRFNKINLKADNWDGDTYGVSKEGQDYLNKIGAKLKNTFNSYNGDSALSQVIQGTYYRIKGRGYILLQIHSGCDVRGGYTTARLFVINNDCGDSDFDCLTPEDVYGRLIPKGADLETSALIEGIDVQRTSAGIIEFDNTYDGHTLRDENHNEIEIDANKYNVEIWLDEC